MEELTKPVGPLNPYARVFFGLWALIALFMVIRRTYSTTDAKQINDLHRRLQAQMSQVI